MQHPTPEQVEQMASLGRLRMPREACGVLVNGQLLELPNHALEDDLTTMTLDDIRDAVGTATIDEVLFWHTHPGGMVGPSTVDLSTRIEGFQYMVLTIHPDGTTVATRY